MFFSRHVGDSTVEIEDAVNPECCVMITKLEHEKEWAANAILHLLTQLIRGRIMSRVMGIKGLFQGQNIVDWVIIKQGLSVHT